MEQRTNIFFRPMLACAWPILITPVLNAQSPCDELAIERVAYSAFDTNTIEVLVTNGSGEIFSYPSFVLLDAQGDTLAREEVAFFGIGTGPQAHYPVLVPGATVPTAPFDATLLLFGLFGDTLFCSWDLAGITLCPQEECIPAEIYLVNTGPLVSFTVYWGITDPLGLESLAAGAFDMDEVTHTHFDSVCLPPGDYMIWLSPFSPIDESYVLGITNNYAFSIGTNVALQQDNTPLDLAFSWYEACIGISQSIADHGARDIQVMLQGGAIQLLASDRQPLGEVSLWASDGRLLTARSTASNTLGIPVEGLATGVLLVRVVDPQGRSFVQRIFIP